MRRSETRRRLATRNRSSRRIVHAFIRKPPTNKWTNRYVDAYIRIVEEPTHDRADIEPIIFIDAEQPVVRPVGRSVALGKRRIDTRWDAGRRWRRERWGYGEDVALEYPPRGKSGRERREAILSRGEDP